MFNQYRPPPIQYLPAFVAAARHNSFKLAAAQLNVSPSAISQQIKTLENHIGLPLFSRQKRELQLTRAGESFYQVAQTTLGSYERGCSQFSETYIAPTLNVSMTPYIANEVVIPQLADFHEKYPDINLVVQTSMRLENLQDKNLDAAIRFGVPPWAEHDVTLICSVYSGLVASKEYFNKHPVHSEKDWQQQTLIHSRTQVNDWQLLLDKFQVKPNKELYFDSYDAGMRAAEEGLGIAIAVFPISNNKITQGKLKTLSQKKHPIEEAYYLVTKPNDHKQEIYQIFLSWLKEIFSAL